MTRSIPRQPLSRDDDLANVAVALAVLHFYVLGHRDSYGSCRECHEIIDRVAPQYHRLRSPNSRAGCGDGSSTTRWSDVVLHLVDPELFHRLVRTHVRSVHPIQAAPSGGFTALAETDVEVIRAAIDEGRSFPASGLLGQFRCTPNDPTTPHDKGDASTGPQSCSHCMDLAFMAAAAFDRRAAPEGAERRPGRLRAIAQHTLYRINLGRLVLTSPQIVRPDEGMPAKPDADLPDAIACTIDERSHRGPLNETDERPYPTLVYLEMIVAMKWWALEVVDPTVAEELPVHRIGEKLGLSSAEADRSWQFILDACSEVPRAQELLHAHLLDHLDRRRGCTSLEQARRGQESDEVTETNAFVRFQVEAHSDAPSLLVEVEERVRVDWRLPPTEVTTETVRHALVEVLGERAGSGRPSPDLESDLLDALQEGDVPMVAALPGFEDLVAEIKDAIHADEAVPPSQVA